MKERCKKVLNIVSTFWNKLHRWIRLGSQILLFGIGLDALGIIDGGNFLLFGMLAWLSFYPGLIMLVAGIVATGVNKIRKK